MSSEKFDYDSISAVMAEHNMVCDAAEVQGIICGMLAGGMPSNNTEWLGSMADFVNSGEPLAAPVKSLMLAMQEQALAQFTASDFALVLCIPDDSSPINDRGISLTNWVQGFMLGFALFQTDLKKTSADVQEVLHDFQEISRMDEQMNQDQESEQALMEVIEYVRVSAMICFNELSKFESAAADGNQTLH